MRRAWLALAALASACVSSTEWTTIESEPPGARVFVDGALVGEAPVEVELARRTHRVRLEKDGFEPKVDHISVTVEPDRPWVLGYLTYDRKYTFEESYRFALDPEVKR